MTGGDPLECFSDVDGAGSALVFLFIFFRRRRELKDTRRIIQRTSKDEVVVERTSDGLAPSLGFGEAFGPALVGQG